MNVEFCKELKKKFPLTYRIMYTTNISNKFIYWLDRFILQVLLNLFNKINLKFIVKKLSKVRKIIVFPYVQPFHCIQAFGVECSDGWFELIFKFSEQIENEIKKIPKKERKHYYVTQIKEKYGGLDINFSCCTDKMFDLSIEANDESYTICEWCGQPGSMDEQFGWMITLCDMCKDIRKKDFEELKKEK